MGIKLAGLLGCNFVDIDEEIVKEQHKSIEKIVCENGWPYFRELESQKLVELVEGRKLVVATGGGIILKEKNREMLKDHFFVIWLKASPGVIRKRLEKDTFRSDQRPSLSGKGVLQEVEEILEMRTKYYEETSHMDVSTDELSPVEVVEYIMKNLPGKGKND